MRMGRGGGKWTHVNRHYRTNISWPRFWGGWKGWERVGDIVRASAWLMTLLAPIYRNPSKHRLRETCLITERLHTSQTVGRKSFVWCLWGRFQCSLSDLGVGFWRWSGTVASYASMLKESATNLKIVLDNGADKLNSMLSFTIYTWTWNLVIQRQSATKDPMHKCEPYVGIARIAIIRIKSRS